MRQSSVIAMVFVGLGLIIAPAFLLTSKSPAPAPTPPPVKKEEVVLAKVETAPTLASKCEPYIYDITGADRKRGLTGIAEKVYGGRGYMWPVFLEVNEIPNPNLIFAGSTLLVPCLCDLQPLVKVVIKKVTLITPKVKKTVSAVAPISVQPPTVEPAPCEPCATPTAPATPEVSPVEAPRPPPDSTPTSAPTQTQTQNVIVNVMSPATPTPAVAPQPVPQPAPPAQTPPPPPLTNGFLAIPGSCGTGQINFSWNANPEAHAYKIFRDGTIVKVTTELAWSDTGLVAGKEYIYTIVASNSAGDSPVKWTTPPRVKAPEVCAPAKPTAEVKPPAPAIKPTRVPQSKMLVWSLWDSIGQNPIEPGDTVNMVHGDIGVVVGRIGKFQFEPFMSLDLVKDFPKGYPWNNRVIGKVGGKVVRPFSHGVVEFGIAYAAERRNGNASSPTQTKTGGILFSNGWFGWQQPTRHSVKRKLFTGALPGTFQWWGGNLSPFEKNKGDHFGNFMGTLRFDQGVTLAKIGGVSIIPTGRLQFGFDTYGNPWNNRYTYGGGLKVAIPWKSGVMDFQGGYYCATQYVGAPVAGGSRCGPGFSINFWTGGRKKLGGG